MENKIEDLYKEKGKIIELEKLLYNKLDENIHNLDKLTNKEVWELGQFVVGYKYRNLPLFLLIDKLKLVCNNLTPDAMFDIVTVSQKNHTLDIIKTLLEWEKNKIS